MTTAPLIPDERKHLASAASRHGSATLGIPALPAGPVAVAVNCRGRGVMSVSVGDVSGLTFPCTAAHGGTYTVLNFEHAHDDAAVRVSADPSIRWSLSLGAVPGN